jgi:hypothetical protein
VRLPGQGHTASECRGKHRPECASRVLAQGLLLASAWCGSPVAPLMCFLHPLPVPPQIAGPRELHTQVSVVQDGETTLECNATGKPLPTVTWEKDGHPVGMEPGLRLQNRDQRLHVELAQEAHTGHYRCVAQNMAGSTERRFTISVLGEDQ